MHQNTHLTVPHQKEDSFKPAKQLKQFIEEFRNGQTTIGNR